MVTRGFGLICQVAFLSKYAYCYNEKLYSTTRCFLVGENFNHKNSFGNFISIILLSIAMKHIFSIFLFCCFAISMQAQVSAGGTPVSFTKTFLGDAVPVAEMPPVDVATLMAEDELTNVKGNAYRFGKDMDVNLSLTNSGIWQDLKGGDRVWRLGIHSSGAYSINLIFSQFFMPEGAKMFVYNADKSMVIGAFTSFNNKEHGKFSTDVVKGDHIIIEYFEPGAVRGQGRITVNKVIHAYRNFFFKDNDGSGRGFGDSGPCNINVNCPISAGWENQVNASLLYLLANNSSVCSGAMLNNVLQDGKPYFLSANHCYSSDFATWIFRFNYQSATCTPNQNGPTNQSVSGSTLRARRGDSDFALYELSVTPPLAYNVYYAGWSNVNTPSTSSVCIHHPAGDIKKFSVDNNATTSSTYGGGANTHWRVGNWEQGTTEGGSSGSPLFDQNKRVVGQLHGGAASCFNLNGDDYYGKFSSSWNGNSASSRLRDWLDPNNTGATVLDGTTFNVATSQRDVQLLEITGIPASSCNTTVNGTLRFQNRGSDVLTNFSYRYRTNAGTWANAVWNGSLVFGQSGTVAIPAFTLVSGSYTIEAQVLLVNGQTDQNTSNDNTSFAFAVLNGQSITVILNTDDFGNETTLRIRNSNGISIWQETGFSDNTTYTFSPCLAVGCYTFVIEDDYSDGICCNFGNGSYTVTGPNGIIAQGGQFGASQSTSFCLTVGGGQPPVAVIVSDAIEICEGGTKTFNNGSTGNYTSTLWQFPGGTPSTSTSNNPTITYSTGGTYSATLMVSGAGGADTVTVNNAVIVRSGSFTVSTINTSVVGATDGSATVVTSYPGTYTYQWNTGAQTPTVSGLSAGTYTVTVTEALGCSSVKVVSIGSGRPVGVENLEVVLGAQLYPNPADHGVTLTLNNAYQGTLQVYDGVGRLVYQSNELAPANYIAVSTWAKGVYYLRIAVPQGMVVKKFVVGL